MPENTTAPTTEKPWWQVGLDWIKDAAPAAGEAYEKYTAGRLNDKVADQVKKTNPTDWNKIAKIAGVVVGVVALVWGGIWLLGRSRSN